MQAKTLRIAMLCAGIALAPAPTVGSKHEILEHGCVPAARLDSGGFRLLLQTVANGWNRGDAKLAASCFAPDALYSAPPANPRRGRQALYLYFGGARGRGAPMHMVWHHLLFDPVQQIGVGEYTFRYRIQTHGIVIVKIADGLIHNWREYEVVSPLPWDEFTGDNRF